MKDRFISALKIIFAVAILTWFIRSGKVDFRQLKGTLESPVLVVFILLTLFNFIANSERWRSILGLVGLTVGFWRTISLSLIGNFFNFFIPGGVSGDLIKALYTTKEFPQKRGTAAVSVLFDRILGLWTMMFVAFLSMSFAFDYVRASWTLLSMYLFIIVCLIGGLATYWFHPLLRTISERFQLLRPFGKIARFIEQTKAQPYRLLLALIQSFVSQFFVIVFFYLFATMNPQATALSPAIFFFAVPVGFMATAIPISPGGVGVGQSAFYYLFELVGPGQGQIGALGFTVLQILQFILGLAGGVIFLVYRENDSSSRTALRKG